MTARREASLPVAELDEAGRLWSFALLSVFVRNRATVRHYLGRAESLFQSAQLLADDMAHYGAAVGLLAVHGCISLTDAVLVAEEGARSKGDDHGDAVRELQKVCKARDLDSGGIKHFQWLISKKTAFSYAEDEVRDEELAAAKLKMEQFFKWVYNMFPEIPRTEESNDA